MSTLTTVAQVSDWVKTDLGVPVVCIELPQATIDQIIDDCVQIFHTYAYGEGVYEDYIAINVTKGVSAYNVSAWDLASVVDVNQFSGNSVHGLNTLFSPQLNILGSDWIPVGGSNGQGLTLANYEMALQEIDMVNHYFQLRYRTIFREQQGLLTLIPTPTENGTILIKVHKKEKARYIYNNFLFKELVRARIMKRWGFVLNKRTISFPGGGTVNGEFIYQEGKEAETEAIRMIKAQTIPPAFEVG